MKGLGGKMEKEERKDCGSVGEGKRWKRKMRESGEGRGKGM